MNRRTRLSLASVLALILVLAVPLTAPRPAAAATSCAYFDFSKGTNINSTLTWTWMDTYGRCVYSHSWRAGSGSTKDPCQVGQGWLPNGWYDSPNGMYDNYYGTTIWGRVWSLQNKQCNNGTWRTELFIHTEETPSNGQICNTSVADDPQCWDNTPAYSGAAAGTHDFYSAGCVKVRRKSPEGSWPDAMTNVHSTFHAYGGGGSHGTGRSNLLYVHS